MHDRSRITFLVSVIVDSSYPTPSGWAKSTCTVKGGTESTPSRYVLGVACLSCIQASSRLYLVRGGAPQAHFLVRLCQDPSLENRHPAGTPLCVGQSHRERALFGSAPGSTTCMYLWFACCAPVLEASLQQDPQCWPASMDT